MPMMGRRCGFARPRGHRDIALVALLVLSVGQALATMEEIGKALPPGYGYEWTGPSFAFILGSVPLLLASGAGANSRHSLGTGVVGGMTFATALGVFFIPVLYVVVARATQRRGRPKPSAAARGPAPAGEGAAAPIAGGGGQA